MSPQAERTQVRVGRRTISLSNLDKVLFPDDGITKGRLIEYYTAIAPAMLPYLRDRPLTMERFPDGLQAERVFQKNISRYFPEWIARASMTKRGGHVEHVLANDTPTLVYLANQATITHHVWLSTTRAPTQPDQLIFDLDPSVDDFAAIRQTALELRALLEQAGLIPFVKTSGSRGLHVVVPLRPADPYDVVYGFAEQVADLLVREHPDRLTREFHKVERGARIYMDINRNAYAQTAVAPYTVRARPGAPVAVPLEWDEVGDAALRPDGFGMDEALRRAEAGDPWRGFRGAARSLRKAARSLGVAVASMFFLVS